MKKALVLTLVLLGVGATVFAGAFTGSVDVCARFNKTDLEVFDTLIDIDYTIGTFVFGMNALFDLNAFDNLWFEVDATVGAFEMHGMLDFEPQTPAFVAATGAAKISIGGATLFGVVALRNLGSLQTPSYGLGATLGLYATVGDVSITVVNFFNMTNYAYYYWAYGYDYLITRDAYYSCGVWYKPSGLPYTVLQSNCCLCWNGTSVYVDFPFTCLNVTAYIDFSCTNAFEGFGFWFTGIESGIDWLVIEELDIDFTTTSKDMTVYFGLAFGDFVCVEPIITLEGGGVTITGLTLNALVLEYSYNGVTVGMGEIFDNTWYSWALNGTVRTWGFSSTGALSWSCIYNADYDEVIWITIDGDSCCGGAYDIAVYNFFNTALAGTALFDWVETLASLEVGIGPSVSIGLSMSLKVDGLQWFQICGGFSF
jgi:hypothetical protein